MKTVMKSLVLFVFTFLSTACVSSESEEGNWESLAKSGGEGVFVEKCGMCHRENGMGTGLLGRRYDEELALLENRSDLGVEFVETIVRIGLGNMLPMSRGEVSDEQLATITSYLAKEE